MFVHGAELTAVPRAAPRDADQGTVGLVRRPEGWEIVGNLFKVHGPIKVKDFGAFINSLARKFMKRDDNGIRLMRHLVVNDVLLSEAGDHIVLRIGLRFLLEEITGDADKIEP